MLLQRKNDRRDAISMSLKRRRRRGPPADSAARVLLNAQQEIRIDEDPLERELNSRVETSAIAPAALEELEQRLDVGLRDRSAIRQPSHPRKDLRGARRLCPRSLRAGLAQTKIARRLGVFVAAPVGAVRSTDLHRADARVAHVDLIVRQNPAPLQRLRKTFRFPQLPHERHADDARPRRHRHADLEAGVAGELHVRFPFGSAGKARLAVAGVARGRRSARAPCRRR